MDEILSKAKSLLKNLDVLIDVYDFSIMWASEKTAKTLGYSVDELKKMYLFDIMAYRKDRARSMTAEDFKRIEGVRELKLKSKDKKPVPIKTLFKFFKFGDGYYLIGEILEYKK